MQDQTEMDKNYTVEKIVGHARVAGRVWYKVKWRSYTETTWNARSEVWCAASLPNCITALLAAGVTLLTNGCARRWPELATYEKQPSELRRVPECLLKLVQQHQQHKCKKAQLQQASQVKAKVEVRPTASMGKGLFAAATISKGVVVAKFVLRECSMTEWVKHCKRNNVKVYNAIQINNSGRVVYDPLCSNHNKPKWTRLNHSRRYANVKAVRKGGLVMFVTVKRVFKGAQLKWCYNNTAPEKWTEEYCARFEDIDGFFNIDE